MKVWSEIDPWSSLFSVGVKGQFSFTFEHFMIKASDLAETLTKGFLIVFRRGGASPRDLGGRGSHFSKLQPDEIVMRYYIILLYILLLYGYTRIQNNVIYTS